MNPYILGDGIFRLESFRLSKQIDLALQIAWEFRLIILIWYNSLDFVPVFFPFLGCRCYMEDLEFA